MPPSFRDKLRAAVPNGIGLCVGLDPVVEQMPQRFRRVSEPLSAFCRAIIASTSEYASAYKPNLAFFEAYGAEGWRQLEQVVRAVPSGKIVIADAKRGDIGSTAKAYVSALFDHLRVDAATINPYLGGDALDPFLSLSDKGGYILAVTSNPGGADLQNLVADGLPIYIHVVRLARRLNKNANVGLVMGATRSELWPSLLAEAVDLPLLVPGIGAQGGDLNALRTAVRDYPAPILVNASRSIIYASKSNDFAEAAREAARDFANLLRG